MAEGEHNPSFEGSWTDESGDVWRRKGKPGRALEERRIQSLLRRADVPLVVWEAFETFTYDDPSAKEAAAKRVRVAGAADRDVRASEWQTEDGRMLLMLEHFC